MAQLPVAIQKKIGNTGVTSGAAFQSAKAPDRLSIPNAPRESAAKPVQLSSIPDESRYAVDPSSAFEAIGRVVEKIHGYFEDTALIKLESLSLLKEQQIAKDIQERFTDSPEDWTTYRDTEIKNFRNSEPYVREYSKLTTPTALQVNRKNDSTDNSAFMALDMEAGKRIINNKNGSIDTLLGQMTAADADVKQLVPIINQYVKPKEEKQRILNELQYKKAGNQLQETLSILDNMKLAEAEDPNSTHMSRVENAKLRQSILETDIEELEGSSLVNTDGNPYGFSLTDMSPVELDLQASKEQGKAVYRSTRSFDLNISRDRVAFEQYQKANKDAKFVSKDGRKPITMQDALNDNEIIVIENYYDEKEVKLNKIILGNKEKLLYAALRDVNEAHTAHHEKSLSTASKIANEVYAGTKTPEQGMSAIKAENDPFINTIYSRFFDPNDPKFGAPNIEKQNIAKVDAIYKLYVNGKIDNDEATKLVKTIVDETKDVSYGTYYENKVVESNKLIPGLQKQADIENTGKQSATMKNALQSLPLEIAEGKSKQSLRSKYVDGKTGISLQMFEYEWERALKGSNMDMLVDKTLQRKINTYNLFSAFGSEIQENTTSYQRVSPVMDNGQPVLNTDGTPKVEVVTEYVGQKGSFLTRDDYLDLVKPYLDENGLPQKGVDTETAIFGMINAKRLKDAWFSLEEVKVQRDVWKYIPDGEGRDGRPKFKAVKETLNYSSRNPDDLFNVKVADPANPGQYKIGNASILKEDKWVPISDKDTFDYTPEHNWWMDMKINGGALRQFSTIKEELITPMFKQALISKDKNTTAAVHGVLKDMDKFMESIANKPEEEQKDMTAQYIVNMKSKLGMLEYYRNNFGVGK